MKATRALLFFGMATVASATSVTFNFNSVAENASATTIASYMTSVLTAAGCTGCSVTVTGAIADTTYDGENHVTGPGSAGSGGTAVKSLTLGTSDGASASNTNSPINSSYDTFLATTKDDSTNISSQITMKFSGFTINGNASFDYEIFPNGSCQSASNCSSTPDFKFDVNGTSPVSTFGTNGVQYGITPGTGNDGNANNSQLSTSEASLQYIGTWSGSLSNANELDFIDWPETIGVDNLTVSWNTNTQSPVPEPFSVVLLGTIVGGIALRKRIRKAVA
jgi:hypothetical protein